MPSTWRGAGPQSLPLRGEGGSASAETDEVEPPPSVPSTGERAVPHRSARINFHLISQLTLTAVSLRLGQGRVWISSGDPVNTGPSLRKPSKGKPLLDSY